MEHKSNTARNTELLTVTGFAGIKHAELSLSRMNVFIGPQASGKSVCAKLIFYFKQFVRRLPNDAANELKKSDIAKVNKDIFEQYFPPTCWGPDTFTINYFCGELEITVERKERASKTVTVTLNDAYNELLRVAETSVKGWLEDEGPTRVIIEYTGQLGATGLLELGSKLDQLDASVLKNENYFIPAGRSFFSTFKSNVFSFMDSGISIDPFIVAFGRLYERSRQNYTRNSPNGDNDKRTADISDQISKIICGTYERLHSGYFIKTTDGRMVAEENSSSGQQEALPLAITLAWLSTPSRRARSSVFVEEPEAHLYPSAQREIVNLLSRLIDVTSTQSFSQYVITTHSPYILSTLNNLMYADLISQNEPSKRDLAGAVVGQASPIPPINVRAYSFDSDGVTSIIDPDTQLVRATVLDRVSGYLATDFQSLMDIADENADS